MTTYQIPLDMEMITDNFAGGGGASVGIEMALKRPVNIAINHDGKALGMHAINHPLTRHYCEDVWEVDPVKVTGGRPVMLAWFSPDCKHHSKARGQKPVNKNIRGLAWVAMRWAATVKPRVIMLENVEEFQQWGPVVQAIGDDGKPKFNPDGSPVMIPCTQRKGMTFRSFVRQLEDHGYNVEWRELRACDYGAPTIRKRLFLIARCDGQPIVWPKPTHAKKPAKGSGLKPYRTAAECIDWSIPCPSIFDRQRPLAENTMKRIAAGLKRFVIDNPTPYLVSVNHGDSGGRREYGLDEPLNTVTQHNGMALITPYLTEHANASSQRNFPADEPLRTQCAQVKGGHFALVAPVLAGVGGRAGQSRPRSADEPMATITAKADAVLVAPILSTYYGNKNPEGDPRGCAMDSPIGTQTTENRHALVAASMVQVGYGEREGQAPRALDIENPLGTLVGTGKHAICAAWLQRQFGTSIGSDMDDPIGTLTTKNKTSLCMAWLTKHFKGVTGVKVDTPMPTILTAGAQTMLTTAHIMKMRGENLGHTPDEPLHTISAGGTHHASVQAFLLKYYGNEKDGQDLQDPMGTVTTRDRFGLVTVHGELYRIVDIGMRMLTPRELARAQGFPDDYIIDRAMVAEQDENGITIVQEKPLTKTEQVRMIGNSVCPPIARALVSANINAAPALEQIPLRTQDKEIA